METCTPGTVRGKTCKGLPISTVSDSTVLMPTRRITYRLYPSASSSGKLHLARKMHCELYNAALANRRTQYWRFGHSVDYFEQQNSLPAFKEVWPEYKELGSHTLQATLKRVDFAYQRFFRGLGRSAPSLKQSAVTEDGHIQTVLVGKFIKRAGDPTLSKTRYESVLRGGEG